MAIKDDMLEMKTKKVHISVYSQRTYEGILGVSACTLHASSTSVP